MDIEVLTQWSGEQSSLLLPKRIWSREMSPSKRRWGCAIDGGHEPRLR